MSKMNDIALQLDERAVELGFADHLEALGNGYEWGVKNNGEAFLFNPKEEQEKGDVMKTVEDFEHDKREALKVMAKFLEDKGYDVEMFTNMEGNDTLTAQVLDEGEQVGYFAVFERY